MDLAYDHIQEEVLSADEVVKQTEGNQKQVNLNTEFKEAYKSFSASPWGARLGGFFSDVKKQGETYYEGARQEASVVSGEALKGFTDLKSTIVNRTRSLSNTQATAPSEGAASASTRDPLEADSTNTPNKERTESEALRDSEGLIARFRTEATKRLKDIEKAEDAADEALLKFGKNIRNFLRDAVTIAAPSEEASQGNTSKVLFESKDQDGKRVIHSTRFDAQLHAIHSSSDSFAKDPASAEYEKWTAEFDVEKKTDAIASDLEKYQELRRSMEKLVPEKVDYADFWARYYFLLMVIETEEQRRRDMLKGAALSPDETIAWDDDSDSDSQPSTPHAPPSSTSTLQAPTTNSPSTSTSTTTTAPNDDTIPAPTHRSSTSTLKPTDARPRRSQDQSSLPDSDASYDLVSGATSRAPGSPKEERERESSGRDEDEDNEEEGEEDGRGGSANGNENGNESQDKKVAKGKKSEEEEDEEPDWE